MFVVTYAHGRSARSNLKHLRPQNYAVYHFVFLFEVGLFTAKKSQITFCARFFPAVAFHELFPAIAFHTLSGAFLILV